MRHLNAFLRLSIIFFTIITYSTFTYASAAPEKVLRRSLQSSPENLDPHTSFGIHALAVLRDLYQGLTSAAADLSVKPAIAEKWEISPDQKTYVFHLRKDAKWSDGTPLTAHHFVFGLKRSIDPKTTSPKSSLLYVIENGEEITKGTKKLADFGVKALDDNTLEIKLQYPHTHFLNMLTHSSFFPFLPAMVEKYDNKFPKDAKYITNGAFSLESWHPQGEIVLKKNPHYMDAKNVKLDKVVYIPVEDQNALFKMYRANEIDFTYIIPDSQFSFIKENYKDELKKGPSFSIAGLGFNLLRPPFKDNLNLRKALSMAINREFICEKVTGTGETPAYSWIDPSIKEVDIPYLDFKNLNAEARLAEAKKLYQAAGYSDAKPLTVELRYDTNDNHKRLVIAVASMWKKLGVKVDLVNEELKVFLNNRRLKQVTESFRNFYQMDYYDPYSFTQLFQGDSGMNMTGYRDEAYEVDYKKAMETTNPESRKQQFFELAKKAQDTHALVPIFHSVTKRLVKPYVKGYEHNALDIVYSMNLSIEK